ncbi:hypothetical protein CKAH01_07095 [Colletotrichum kahawae]|uniref:Uncharacterized protein n=1 Tax=Colletotrichum kahawae TaxID=34407 RepID=A0AAE0D263_COLKA|nr:hypothetical protein CKAH01_07095 [Colletotrichum kahawae]
MYRQSLEGRASFRPSADSAAQKRQTKLIGPGRPHRRTARQSRLGLGSACPSHRDGQKGNPILAMLTNGDRTSGFWPFLVSYMPADFPVSVSPFAFLDEEPWDGNSLCLHAATAIGS